MKFFMNVVLAFAATTATFLPGTVLAQSSPAMAPAMPMGPTASPPVEGPAMAFPPAQDCQTVLFMNLAGCLEYVTKGSNLTTPGKECCSGFKTVVDNNPICLCSLLGGGGGGATSGLDVDTTRALMIPTACKVSTPPVDLCSLLSPTGSPVGSPAGGPGSSMGQMSPASSPASSNPSSKATTITTSLSAAILLAGISLSLVAMY